MEPVLLTEDDVDGMRVGEEIPCWRDGDKLGMDVSAWILSFS